MYAYKQNWSSLGKGVFTKIMEFESTKWQGLKLKGNQHLQNNVPKIV